MAKLPKKEATTKEKGMAVGKPIAIVVTSFMVLVCLFAIILIVQTVVLPSEGTQHGSLSRAHLIGEYTVDNQNWHPLVSKADYKLLRGERYVKVRGHFRQPIEIDNGFALGINNIQVQLSLNGTQLADFGRPDTYPEYSIGPGKCYIQINIERTVTEQDEFELVLTNPYKRYGADAVYNHLNGIFIVGPLNALSLIITKTNWFFSILGIAFVVVGLIASASMILLMRDGIRNRIHQWVVMSSFSVFAMTGGYYLLVSSLEPVLALFINNPTACNVMVSVSYYLLCMGVLMNYMSVVTKPILMHIIWHNALVGLLGITVLMVLQFFGITDLYEFVEFPVLIGTVITFIAVPILYYEWKGTGKVISIIQLTIMMPFIISMVIQELDTYVFHLFPQVHFPQYGVMLTGTLQFYRMIKLIRVSSQKRLEYERTKAELSETRITMAISQIQPHFLYNALNTIQYLCATDPPKASYIVEKFAKYLRGNMDSLSQKEPIPFDKEISHLENYLAIEKLRFPEITFKYKFDVSDFKLPALTVQPLVENSIKHGVRSLGEKGLITISTWQDEKRYFIRVEDNGIGFDMEAAPKDDGRSHVGIENIVARVKNMMQGEVIMESERGKGTRTTIVIPKGEKNESVDS